MVTVLMAVWNSPLQELSQAIDSILAQTLAAFEFLIIDDGSTDPFTRTCLAVRAGADTRIRLLVQEHRGLTASLNLGLDVAKGDVIARQDSDDWSAPERLERQVQFLDRNPAIAVCGTDAWTHQQNGLRLWRTRLTRPSGDILDAFERGNPFVHGSTMFRKEAAIRAGGYATELRCSQDYDFFWRLCELGGGANLEEPLYHYRYSAGSVSAGKAWEQALSLRATKKLAAARRRGEPRDVAAALLEARLEMSGKASVHSALLKQADHLMLAGAYRDAGRAYFELLREHPANPLTWAKLARLGVFMAMPSMRETFLR